LMMLILSEPSPQRNLGKGLCLLLLCSTPLLIGMLIIWIFFCCYLLFCCQNCLLVCFICP
jgi:hypothetical protein